jgi:tetratricopeptide (TPR) repeat protein
VLLLALNWSSSVVLQPMGAKTTDFFVSYTGADVAWARWFDAELRGRGYSTIVQLYDFKIGDSFVRRMQEALRDCRWTLCLLSKAYLNSRWCEEELWAALSSGSLVPVRIDNCEPAGLLSSRGYLDLCPLDEASASTLLELELKKLAGEEPRPTLRPAFPGTTKPEAARFPGARSARGALPPVWNVPRNRNAYFTGRDDLLEGLRRRLTAPASKFRAQTITGLGGVGKSEVALEFAYRYASDYDGIWWLRAEDPTTLAADYVALGRELGLGARGLPDAAQAEMVFAVRRALSASARFLLIFDNADDPRQIERFLPQGPDCQVLVTTRAPTWPGAATETVVTLPTDDAIAFLCGRTGQSDRESARQIVALLGGLPLALEQAAGYTQSRGATLAEYASLLQEHGLRFLERGQPHNHERTVGTTWLIAFSTLGATPGAQELLILFAFLAPEAINLVDLREATGALQRNDGSSVLPQVLLATLSDKLAFLDAKAALLRHSLVHAEGDVVTVHRLIQTVTLERIPEAERQPFLVAATRLVDALFPQNSDDARYWKLSARLLPHARALLPAAGSVDPETCIRLLNRSGNYFTGIGNYGEAELAYRRGLALLPASKSLEEAELLNGLALALKRSDRLTEAEQYYRHALELYAAAGAAESSEAAEVLNNLAALLTEQKRLPEAEAACRKALAIHGSAPHPDPSELARLARVLGNLATILHKCGLLTESEVMHRRSLELEESLFGSEHARVAVRLSNLAQLLVATHRAEAAKTLLQRALAIDEAALGPNHANVALRHQYLGRALAVLGQLPEAQQHLEQAVGILKKALGPGHSKTSAAEGDLAGVIQQVTSPTDS